MAGTASSNQGAREVYGGVSLFTPNGDSAMDETTDSVKVSVVASSAAGATQYAEDTASLQGDFVNMAGVVRKDVAATLVDTDGDRTQMQVDATGLLRVNASGAAVPVTDNGGSLTVDGTVTVTDGSGSLTVDGTVTVQDGGGSISVDDNAGSLTVDNPVLSVVGGGTEATAQRVTIATDSTGVLSVDDNGGSLTVDGTVAATQSGGWTVTVQDGGNVISVDDGAGSLTVDGTVAVSGLAGSTTGSAPTAVTVNASSGTVIASNANRKGLVLTNTSTGGQSISLHLANGTAVLNSGITLWPGDSFTMTPWTFTTAQINGIASAASGAMGIQEMT